MPRQAPLSKSETEVARVVWLLGQATVRQVLERLPAARQIDYKTVQTYLRRLEAKGYLQTRRDGRAIVYRPKVRPAQVIRQAVHDFVARLFDGQPLPLVEHLIASHRLSHADVDRLRTLVDQLEDAGHDRR